MTRVDGRQIGSNMGAPQKVTGLRALPTRTSSTGGASAAASLAAGTAKGTSPLSSRKSSSSVRNTLACKLHWICRSIGKKFCENQSSISSDEKGPACRRERPAPCVRRSLSARHQAHASSNARPSSRIIHRASPWITLLGSLYRHATGPAAGAAAAAAGTVPETRVGTSPPVPRSAEMSGPFLHLCRAH